MTCSSSELRRTVEARRGPDAGSVLRHHTAGYPEVSAAGLVVADQLKIG